MTGICSSTLTSTELERFPAETVAQARLHQRRALPAFGPVAAVYPRGAPTPPAMNYSIRRGDCFMTTKQYTSEKQARTSAARTVRKAWTRAATHAALTAVIQRLPAEGLFEWADRLRGEWGRFQEDLAARAMLAGYLKATPVEIVRFPRRTVQTTAQVTKDDASVPRGRH